jgi:hypothetical protein
MMAVAATKGPVVEVGGGVYSTNTLLFACGTSCAREVWTFEQDVEWYKQLYVAHATHRFVLYHDISVVIDKIREIKPSVLFIDCDLTGPAGVGYPDRLRLLRELWDQAEILVVHDTEDGVFQPPELWRCFRHVWTFKPEGLPWTTVASQTVDLGELMHRAKVTEAPMIPR